MTTYDSGSSVPTGSDGPKEKAQQAVGTAADEGKHVGEVAMGEAQQVASEAMQQAGDLFEEARTQLQEQSRTQLDRLVGLLREFGDDLEKMTRGESTQGGPAQQLVGQVASRARDLGSQLQGREPTEVLDQVRSFARRRPGAFLLGALATGVVAGRLTRGAKQAHDNQPASTTTTTAPQPTSGPGMTTPGMAGGTAAGSPLAGAPIPPSEPAYPDGSETSGTTWGNPSTPPPTTPPPTPGVDPLRGTP